jgi:hypothetical protein
VLSVCYCYAQDMHLQLHFKVEPQYDAACPHAIRTWVGLPLNSGYPGADPVASSD